MRMRIHIFGLCLAAGLSLAGCVWEKPEAEAAGLVNLELNLKLSDRKASRSRAGGYDESHLENETMHSIRILIVRENGTVEYNDYISLASPALQHVRKFKVAGNERKGIYLIVNENSLGSDGNRIVGYDFAAIERGQPLASDDIGLLRISSTDGLLPADQPLPMNAYYEIDMPSTDMRKDLWVLRAAVKVSYTFRNQSSRKVSIADLKFAPAAWEEYYFLHAPAAAAGQEPALEHNIDGPDWEVAAFAVPTLLGENTMVSPAQTALSVNAGASGVLPSFYILESALQDGAAYSTQMRINGQLYGKDIGLDASIVRNTHLKVNVIINDKEVVMKADVIPYTECVLEPEFGI